MRRVIVFVVLCVAAVFPGCDSDPGQATLVVSNVPDAFAIAGDGNTHNGVHTYSWSCSTGQADIALAQGISGGSARIEVFDGAGTLVHDNTYPAVLGGAVSAQTRPDGVAGTWTLQFTFTNATWESAISLTADTINRPDRLDFAGAYNLTGSLVFHAGWDAGASNVDLAAGLSSGSLRIRVWDAGDVLRFDTTYSAPMLVAASDVTAGGTAGAWTIQIDFVGAVNGAPNGTALSVWRP